MKARLAALAGLAVFASSPAAGLDLFSGVGVAYQSTSFWHDASGGVPAYGNPTSVLDYKGLFTPYVSIGAATQFGTWDAEAQLRLEGFGAGTFEDRDYYAGQVLFSETFSTATLQGAEVDLRLYPDYVFDLAGGGTARPLLTFGAQAQSLRAFGVTCGLVCLGGPVAADIAVIQHDLYGFSVGAGAEATYAVGESGTVSLTGIASLGALLANDSHWLRGDLGPTPNIVSRYGVLGLEAAARYSHAFSDTVSGNLGVGAGLEAGWGTTTFAPATATPLTFTGGFQRVRLHIGIGLEGHF